MKNIDQNQIDLFLKDELSTSEKESFLQRVKSDPLLQEEIMAQQELLGYIEQLGDLKLKGLVAEVHQEALLKPKNKGSRWYKLIIALIALLFILAALFFKNRAPKHERLYQAYYEDFHLPFTSRGSETHEILDQASNFYLQQKYQQALPLFSELMASDLGNSKICLAIGICQLEIKQYTDAIATFDKLVEKNDRLYAAHALWYTALAYLQQNNIPACQKALQPLIDDPGLTFHSEAKELMSSF